MEENYTFEGQRPKEDVIFVLRRHPWVLAQAGFIITAVIIVVILSYLIFGFSNITYFLIIGAVIFFVIYGFYQWFVFNNYLYILTTERIIIIEQGGLFARKIIEAELDKIQNVTIEIKGPMKTLLNFGNIILRTAGVDPIIVLQNVENPYEIQQKIIKASKKITINSSGDTQNVLR